MILSKYDNKAYILGIGGSSMQAIAIILKSMGLKVYGSDIRYDKFYDILSKNGIEVDILPDLEKIKKVDFVLYSLAISESSEEFIRVKSLGKPMISRKEFLKLFSKKYPEVIAVSGTHGKSTTTYLISEILNSKGFRATYHIGASSKTFEGGGLFKGEEMLVTEACEYKDSFLSLSPSVAVILNIEYDHPDYFSSYSRLLSSFYTFSSNIKDNGILIINESLTDKFKKYLLSINRCDIRVISVGEGGEYDFKNVKESVSTTFDLLHNGKLVGNFTTNLNGYHNIYNTIISIIVASYYGVKNDEINKSLSSISGLEKRYEHLGFYNGAEIISDYAHHPSEIKVVIETTKTKGNGRIFVVFQPHTYSRTTALFNDFVKCFNLADEVIITKTFRSREKSGVKTSFDLFLAISENKQNTYYYDDFISVAKHLKDRLNFNDKLLLLGAGDISYLYNLLK